MVFSFGLYWKEVDEIQNFFMKSFKNLYNSYFVESLRMIACYPARTNHSELYFKNVSLIKLMNDDISNAG